MSSSASPFLVTGATGSVGREVVRALLEAGQPVRVAMRHTARARVGTTAVAFDFTDAATYGPALAGVRGVFLMRPNPVLNIRATLNRFLDVAAASGVGHVAFLSVAGAERNRMVPHYRVEQHLMQGPLRWTMLRAGFFMQNLTGPYRRDIMAGRLVLPAGGARVAYVDASDLGDVAALALCEPQVHGGRAYHLTGPDSLSFEEVVSLLSEVLGRRVTYHAATLWEFWRHSRGQGVRRLPTFAYTIVHAALGGGSGAATDPTLARLLGRPGRTLRDFIERHRSAWQ